MMNLPLYTDGSSTQPPNNCDAKSMLENNTIEPKFSSDKSSSPSDPPTSKQRKKRKWDQPAEPLISCGVLPSSNSSVCRTTVGNSAVPFLGVMPASSALSSNFLQLSYVNMLAPMVQQQAAVVVNKLNQSKIQEDLIIAREIIINDADPALRYKLTKRQTQEEIQKSTGAVVITRGKYQPPNAAPDGEKPLYLHISAGAHLKETAERILAVDRAAAVVEDMLKQVSQPLSTCVYVGFDADPSLNIAARIRGPNDQYINHIMNETGATVVLRGRGSGFVGSTQGEVGQQAMHLFLSSNSQKSLEYARLLSENLLDTISREYGVTRVSSCKLYGAVPPPQQLLVGGQSSGTERNSSLSFAGSLACSAATNLPGVAVSSLVAPVASAALHYGQVAQPGGVLPPSHSQANGLHSLPLSTACTSYGGYAGIYPEATPLQQVALALRQSSAVTSIAAPTTQVISATKKCASETERRTTQKRKFQELPSTLAGVTRSPQNSSIHDQIKCSSGVDKKVDSTLPRTCLRSLLPSGKASSFPDVGNMPPPPHPPKFPSSTSSWASSSRAPPPPPAPKYTSSLSGAEANNKDIISNKLNPATVPDTLVKLMEYGDDDDDDDDDGHETLQTNTNQIADSKPFWAA